MVASFKTPNLALPVAGSMGISETLDFTAQTVLAIDLTAEYLDGKLDFIQSVFIDNADNSANCDLIFSGGPIPQRIRALPFSQGWYPVSWPIGAARLAATSQGGIKVNVIFANFAMPYDTWAPLNGTFAVPALVNKAVNGLNFPGAGNAQLVAGVAAQSVKLYRGIFSVDAPTILRWTDGPGGAVLFAAQLTAGGSVTFQGSGVNWFNTSAGNDLTLNSSAACNVYGGFGYVQS
ncbi:MAG TPA: DUF1859 domain-containing protein [Armatimonadota bacterium]|nr:DUF1859 domain-containing protein [Armatimonadota bacterium]